MIKRIKCIALITVCGLVFGKGYAQQAPGIEWQNTIGGSNEDQLHSIQQTTDGGFILAGHSKSNISGDKAENCNGASDYWIVKTDAASNIQWQHTIGGSDEDRLYSMSQTTDGGYICGGWSLSGISGNKTENNLGAHDYWVIKLDASGSIQWQNTIGGSSIDQLYSIAQTYDGGYICGGGSLSNISGDKNENIMGGGDYWVVKLDGAGNIQWQNTIGGSDGEQLYSIAQTSDGGYICGGVSWSNISGDKTENCIGGFGDYWVIKLDASGNIQWQNTIGGTDEDQLYSIAQTYDGGYICGGYSSSNISGDKTENSINNSSDYWVVKLDATGNIQWDKTIGGSSLDLLNSISQTTDGGYICGGNSQSNISGDKTENSNNNSHDYWVVKLKVSGNIEWQKTIGGNDEEVLNSVSETINGGYILGGFSQSNISGDKTENSNGYIDYWIVKLAPDTITSVSNLQPSIFNLQLFPNPATNNIYLTITTKQTTPLRCEIINVLGEKVFQSTIINQQSSINLDVSFLAKGIYLVRVGNGKSFENKKLVIE